MSDRTSSRRATVEIVQRGPLEEKDHSPHDGAPPVTAPALVQIVDRVHQRHELLAFTLTDLVWELASVTVQRSPDGEPLIIEDLLALPLANFVALAVDELDRCAAEEPLLPPERSSPDRLTGGDQEPASVPVSDLEGQVLATVARVYREALASSEPRERMAPTAAVARVFGVNRSQASRLVSRARRQALLNPALPRRPGEAQQSPALSG